MNYTELKRIIDNNLDIIDFAEYGQGCSQDWILKAEKRLGVKFPPSYIWWLKNYSGGQINGEEIFSVYGIDFDTVVGGDVVYINELNKNNKNYSENQLIIHENDQGESYYFDLTKSDDQGEFAVYTNVNNTKYANNFLEFLMKKIEE